MFPPWRRGWGGPGWGREQRRCPNRPGCIYSCLTQHNLIFHIKDQIIFQLQLITHPQSTSKTSASAQPARQLCVRLDFTEGFSEPATQPLPHSQAFERGRARMPLGSLPARPPAPLMPCLPAEIAVLSQWGAGLPRENPLLIPAGREGTEASARGPLLGEEAEAQTGQAPFPISHGLEVAEQGAEVIQLCAFLERNLGFLTAV